MTWNCAGGVIASSIDENSQPTSYGYDNEWRLNQTSYPDGGQVSTTPRWAIASAVERGRGAVERSESYRALTC